jgi:aminoglycoside 6'-N-acetyltransferase
MEDTRPIAFRPLAPEDLAQLFLWLIRPHVSRWYSNAPGSFAEVEAKYGPRTRGETPVQAFIVRVGDRDAGYAQVYPIDSFTEYAAALDCGPGVAGIDLFIGELELMHRGLGARIVQRFLEEIVFAREGVTACIAGPAEGDEEAIRAFEKAGFARWKRVQLEGRTPEYALRRERG